MVSFERERDTYSGGDLHVSKQRIWHKKKIGFKLASYNQACIAHQAMLLMWRRLQQLFGHIGDKLYMQRLISKIFLERRRLDQECDKINHKSKIIRHYKLVRH
jgi:hypothetical protein